MDDPKMRNYGSSCTGLPSLKQIWSLSLDEYWKRGKLLGNAHCTWSGRLRTTNQNYKTWCMQVGFWTNWKESVRPLDIQDPISQPRSIKDWRRQGQTSLLEPLIYPWWGGELLASTSVPRRGITLVTVSFLGGLPHSRDVRNSALNLRV